LSHYENIFPEAAELRKSMFAAESKMGAGALNYAFELAAKAGKQIFVIIDEYDHFANDLIAIGTVAGSKFYKAQVTANGLVRDFYERLKIAAKSSVVNRIFITGISPVMLDDLTSGFNIAVNLTLDEKYNEMMGFTREEVDTLMAVVGVDPALINVDMEAYYNGYLFNEYGENRVYNPSMILYFFDRILKTKKPPKNIIDDNLKTDYNRLRRLVQNDQNREKLMDIAENNGVVSDIISKFPIDKLEDDKFFISLLFYMGLLTIDKLKEGSIGLKIPNYSIRTVYWEYIEQLTREWNEDVMISQTAQKDAIRELAYRGNPAPFIDYVSQNVFSRLSNRDLRQFNEKYIKLMLLSGLFQSKLYVPVTEMEVTQGYTDIYLQRSHWLPDLPYEWVWELKYISKSNASDAEITAKQTEARAQLQQYRSSHRFAGRTDIRYLSLIFIGKDRYVMEEV
jgi:hypothetical protein